MPELPEVEHARRNLERWFRGRKIAGAEADPTRIFRGANPASFQSLRGKVKHVRRKGKYLLVELEGDQGFLSHLGMTGKYVRRPKGALEKYSRARLELDDGSVIHYRDPRLFGRIEPAPASALSTLTAIRELGIDPLEDGLTPAQLKEVVGGSTQALKVALMDQGRVAGLGNIHAAEALYRARLHPGRLPKSLTPAEWQRLTKAIHETIRFALEQEEGEEIEYVEEPGTQNPFLIYGRAGTACKRCKSTVKSFSQGGRTTHFCPKCQPKKGRG